MLKQYRSFFNFNPYLFSKSGITMAKTKSKDILELAYGKRVLSLYELLVVLELDGKPGGLRESVLLERTGLAEPSLRNTLQRLKKRKVILEWGERFALL